MQNFGHGPILKPTKPISPRAFRGNFSESPQAYETSRKYARRAWEKPGCVESLLREMLNSHLPAQQQVASRTKDTK
jgi:hypothetical protein